MGFGPLVSIWAMLPVLGRDGRTQQGTKQANEGRDNSSLGKC